jgi:plasmid stability protein
MITRLDDELHARLKARAAAEGRSLNDLTIEALSALVRGPLSRAELRERLRSAGDLVVPENTARPDPDVLRAEWARGGRAILDALEDDRNEER